MSYCCVVTIIKASRLVVKGDTKMIDEQSPPILNLFLKLLCYLILLVMILVVARFLVSWLLGEEAALWLDEIAPEALISILCFMALRFPIATQYKEASQEDCNQE